MNGGPVLLMIINRPTGCIVAIQMSEKLESKQLLWQHIFKNDQLIIRLIKDHADACANVSINPSLVENEDETAITIESSKWGPIKLKIWAATALGDNFLSDAYIVSAKLNDGEVEYRSFIKVLPHNNLLFLKAQSMKVYHREIATYRDLHSMVRQIRSKAGVRDDEIPICAPDFYHSYLDEVGESGANGTMVVMQDLKQLGFKMVDKKVGCTVEEAKLTLTALANYHALTIALVRSMRDPYDKNTLIMPPQLEFMNDRIMILERLHELYSTPLAAMVKVINALKHHQAGTFLDEQFLNNGKKALSVPTLEECGPLACILHGDCWNNNMMYRYDDNGKVIEMKLVDWQLPRVDHPATDILNFLMTSISPEMRKNHRRSLLYHYYDVLSLAMEKLGLELYSRDQFLKEIHARILGGMFNGLMMYPTMYDDELVTEMDEKDANTEETVKKKVLDVDEMMTDMQEIYNPNRFLTNMLLCDRLIALVEEVKNTITSDDWMFLQ